MDALRTGEELGMTDGVEQESPDTGITSPDGPTHEATTPPGNGDVDPEKLRQAEAGLETPGAGH